MKIRTLKVLSRAEQKEVKGAYGASQNCTGLAPCYVPNGEGECGTCEEWIALLRECLTMTLVDSRCAGR